MNKIVLCVSFFVISLISLISLNVAFATVRCCYYEDTPSTLVQVSPPYGYFTHHPGDGLPTDSTIDSKAALKLSGTSFTYRVNTSGVQGVTTTVAKTQIVAADDNWYSTLSTSSSLPSLTTGTDTTSKPSLFATECGTGTSGANSINEIGFCDVTAYNAAVKRSGSHSSGQFLTFSEADMVFDSSVSWT